MPDFWMFPYLKNFFPLKDIKVQNNLVLIKNYVKKILKKILTITLLNHVLEEYKNV